MISPAECFKEIFRTQINRTGANKLLEWMESKDFFTAPASRKYNGAYEGGLVEHSYISFIAFSVFRRLHFQLGTICHQLISFSYQTMIQLVPIFSCSSLNTYYELLNGPVAWRYSAESRAITGLLHDVCKANFYKKTETGWAVNDRLPMGHGEKSVYLIMKHMELTDDEALAIRWHMGAYDDAFRGGSKAFNIAMDRCPLIFALHQADTIATMREKSESWQ